MEQNMITYNGRTINYAVVKARRKTIGIVVTKDGAVTIRIPHGVSKKEVERIVASKLPWIYEKVTENEKRFEEMTERKNNSLKDGGRILYEGTYHTIHMHFEEGLSIIEIRYDGESFHVRTGTMDPDKLRPAFVKWFRGAAKIRFQERVDHYIPYTGKTYNTIRIKEQKGCYGSCSSKCNLNFNWKCVLAPKEVLDYIVVHELCHLIQMNHSQAFWHEVERIMPDYKAWRAWLRENGKFLEI
ncbi:MAG: M48 family metallopeptidase [Lachnospiraceae bacterium]|nr:M48 family metallopeptidase [Lachnospiraceae bacterium]